jgi:hypothetical protein
MIYLDKQQLPNNTIVITSDLATPVQDMPIRTASQGQHTHE